MLPEIKPADKCAECRRLEAEEAKALYNFALSLAPHLIYNGNGTTPEDYNDADERLTAHRATCPHWREALHERDA